LSDEVNKTGDRPENPDILPAEPTKKESRKEYMARYYVENKKVLAEQRKAKRLTQREEINAAERERLATDPAAHEQRINTNRKMRKNRKERIATDPNEQKKHEERNALRRQRHIERMATDPEYRAQREEFNRIRREKRQQKEKEGDEP
jgi:hypothetical protein